MKAKEMFEELGYEIVYENKEVLRYRLNRVYIEFWKVYERITGEKIKELLRISTIDDRPYLLNMKELKAINKQVEELGWK